MIANTNKLDNNDNLDGSLQKLIKGTGIVIIGSLISSLFIFLTRILIANYWTENEYGIFSLSFAIVSIFTVISSLGLIQGVTRNIAYNRYKNDKKKVSAIILISFFLSAVMSIFTGLILFLSSEFIAVNIFHEHLLVFPLKISSVIVPILTLTNIVVSIFRGFGQIKPLVYFSQIAYNSLFFIFLLLSIAFSSSFLNIFYVNILSSFIILISLIVYTIRKIRYVAGKLNFFILYSLKSIKTSIVKDLMFFSLPLLGTAILSMIVGWTDTLMLGAIKGSIDVGLYNIASPTARFISFPLTAVIVTYMPVISGLYAKGKLNVIKRNFKILTKWICLSTFPLFVFLFIFSEVIIEVLFGPAYVPSAIALRILSMGLIINNLVGPCGVTLVAMGKPRFIMFSTLATASLNIILNIFLIPSFSIAGAAVATGVSVVSINSIKIWKLYSFSGVQPLSKNLIKPILFFTILVTIFYFIFQSFLTINGWWLVPMTAVFYVIFALSILFTKSLDLEDLKILLVLKKKMKIKSGFLEKVLTRFL